MTHAWFRFYSEFATDAKVQSLSEPMQRRLVMLFCLESSGDLEKLKRDEIAFALRIDDETFHETLRVFQEKGFCDENGRIRNWDKRQYKSDVSTNRVKKHRNKSKGSKSETVMKRFGNGDVTAPDTDSDTELSSEDKSSSSCVSSEGFDDFFERFPRKRRGSKALALRAYKSALKRATVEEIEIGLSNYVLSDEVRRGFAKGAQAWLNDDRWTIDYRVNADKPSLSTDELLEAAYKADPSLREQDERIQRERDEQQAQRASR